MPLQNRKTMDEAGCSKCIADDALEKQVKEERSHPAVFSDCFF